MSTLRKVLLSLAMVSLGVGCGADAPLQERLPEEGQAQVAALGSAPPAAPGSKLTGFVVDGSLSRTYFLGADNHVYELWFDGQSWHSGDLTQRASAPAAAPGSALTGFTVEGSGGVRLSRVYFLGADNHVYELWFDGQNWHSGDLTQRADAPTTAPGSALTGFVVNGTQSRVYFLGADNHVYELWFDGQNWHSGDLTQRASAPTAAPGSALTGFVVNGNLSRVYFRAADNHVYELWFDGQNWYSGDLTQRASAPSAAPGSALTGFVVNGTQSRVYFLGADNHVYELWFDGQSWHSGDLMQRASAPNAAPGSALTGFTVNGTLSRVYFTGADNQTYELWYDSQNWHSANLTQWASAPNAAPDSALTGFAVNGNLSRTYFLSADNHVNELWYDGLNWHTVDLTATAN